MNRLELSDWDRRPEGAQALEAIFQAASEDGHHVTYSDLSRFMAQIQYRRGLDLQHDAANVGLGVLRSSLGAAESFEGAEDYMVLQPLLEDIRRHRMPLPEAFKALSRGRDGISRDRFQEIMDTYYRDKSGDARWRTCAKAWSLAHLNSAGELDIIEFKSLIAAAERWEARSERSGTPTISAGDQVMAYARIGNEKSPKPALATVL